MILLFQKNIHKRFQSRKLKAYMNLKLCSQLTMWKMYLNSLMKWKLSNFEAKQYTKSIQLQQRAYSLTAMVLTLQHKHNENLRKSFQEIKNPTQGKGLSKERALNQLATIFKKRIRGGLYTWKINTIKGETAQWKQNYINACLGSRLLRITSLLSTKSKRNSFAILLKSASRKKKVERVVRLWHSH